MVRRRAREARTAAVPVPETSLLASALARVDWSDAYATARPAGSSTDPQEWADAMFRTVPRWVGLLLVVREAVVGVAGIDRAGRSAFDSVARTDDEVLLGTDQSHLSFRASVLLRPDTVVLTTVVEIHKRRGRLYSSIVRPLHPWVVRAMLRRAALHPPV